MNFSSNFNFFLHLISKFLTFIKIFTSVVLGVVIIPGILSIFYLVRLFIIGITKLLGLDYDLPISGMDAFFLTDSSLFDRPSFSLCPAFIIQGQINPKHFNSSFYATFIAQTSKCNSNNYAYNRLQQYPELFGGCYYFWKWDRSFDLDSHILYFNGNDEEVGEDNLDEFLASKIQGPYPKHRPLWEINVISNYNGDLNKTLLVFKIHHVIMDAKSFLHMMEYGFMGHARKESDQFLAVRNMAAVAGQNSNWLKDFMYKVIHLVCTPLALMRQLECLTDSNVFLERCARGRPGRSSPWLIGTTSSFNLIDFIKIKNILGVNLTSLFLTGVSAGLAKYMKKYFVEEQCPAFIELLNPAPVAGHPNGDKLINYFTMAVMTLNLNNTQELLQDRIKSMNQSFLASINSPFPTIGFYGLQLLGLFPIPCLQKLTRFASFTSTFSNVAGPTTKWNLFGYSVNEFYSPLPLAGNIPAFGFLLPSYNGSFRISITANSGLIPTQKQLDELCSMISVELNNIFLYFKRQS